MQNITVNDVEILASIECISGWSTGTLRLHVGIAWRRAASSSLRSVCAVGTPFWHDHVAAAIAVRVIDQAKAGG